MNSYYFIFDCMAQLSVYCPLCKTHKRTDTPRYVESNLSVSERVDLCPYHSEELSRKIEIIGGLEHVIKIIMNYKPPNPSE